MKPRLLIVDDDEEIRTQMKWALAEDYEISLTEDRPSAMETVKALRPRVVLLDLGLPPRPGEPEEGLKALAEILALDSTTKVVIITGQEEKAVALQAIGAGAYDFLPKPVEMEELKLLLKRCFHVASLEVEYRQMQKLYSAGDFHSMLGSSAPMRSIFDSIRKVATSNVPVLLLGESGTGKEMAARAIHNCSSRKAEPFIPINCSAIPETLLESELFGHEKGSFTGAHAQRKGRFEAAHGGTLFLDEIGEIPLALQVKLLRFLQEQCIERVGGRQPITIDARIVAATNADLKKSMAAGTFREDLFYRLAVFKILLPPLRDREDDARLLAQFFLHRYCEQAGKPGLTLDPEATRSITSYSWPGNVRQLENCIRRAVIMSEGKRLTARDLDLPSGSGDRAAVSLKDAREQLEREMILASLRRHGGKIAPAATELGVSRPTLYDLMDKLAIAKDGKDH